ncbi:FAD-dependent oxidoreductase, partial [Staphylococcus aureus]|uniref:FAD-dependent oxidoreductase n=1 Tax=Staphylococcus aureus TaxID=1280 RepID=UPI000A9B3B57
MQHNHIDIYNGTGRILGTSIFSPQIGTISVEYEDGESALLPNQFVLIATGSSPAELPFLSFDHDNILSSDDILSLKPLPSSIGISGGGVIGMEFASLMLDLGVDVTPIQAGERILPPVSKQASQLLKKSLSARGVKFY